ncbi:MAG: thioredoxin domain-containing protein [Candidatus Omnitrophica bacterium]|nr:thioredoxin domain-containing protein [Candidatus Omnitrophota bacterium]
MAKKNKQLISFLLVVLVIGLVLGIKYYQKSQPTSELSGRFKGNPNAKIKIVEYMDFQCPACAMGAKYLRERMQKDSQNIYVEMRYFPLPMHTHALLSARFAECAANQNKFWEFHDQLIDHQDEWSKVINAYPSFEAMAKQVSLDMTKLQACLADNKVDQVIKQYKESGQKLGIKATPTYFVNDKMVVGLKDLQKEFKEILGE